ncbi:hypothetical protein DYBT9275_05783 [Dyadobacter sp. CECT 9275]|uniref:BON domain-containing protein n=1 Tax=Dyadobacter helix TaxID=2822344 RepID=A0A916JIZ2_9BACT|nr:BON domain-containing protein [Dyadobacter sp. CECT 9275]CAG5017490.1 hypothetical protein DYBT9275_05783 [Dyadobacter sp. CECT 9275]
MKTDNEIKTEIYAILAEKPALRESLNRIDISIENGIAILVGSIDSHQNRNDLLEVLSRYENLSILTDLTVDPDMMETDADCQLAKTIKNALHSTFIHDDEIEVKVSRGRVFLEGKVYSETERNLAFQSVDRIFGVRRICNNLTFPRNSMR